jgi:benzylsuccinate CoA-transferase BbsE subunit
MNVNRPYSDVRIVDLSGVLSAYSTRLFADLGAEVVLVEPPGGMAERHEAPLAAAPNYGNAQFLFCNAGKKSVEIDLKTNEGKAQLGDLIGTAQIVLLERSARDLLPLVLGVRGERIVTTVSPFGLEGPYADYEGSDLVTQSLGGITWLSGIPGEPPLRLAGEQASMVTSVYTAAAMALALWDLEVSGRGHILDVSAQECIAHSLQNAPQVWDLERRILSRGGTGIRDATENVFACRDGYVFLAAALSLPQSWNAVVNWVKEEGDEAGYRRLKEPDWADRPRRAQADMRDEFKVIFERLIREKSVLEMRDEALRRKVVLAPVCKIEDLTEDPQLIFRSFFQTVRHPELGKDLVFPGAPYKLSLPVWKVESAAPRSGEHNGELPRLCATSSAGGQI